MLGFSVGKNVTIYLPDEVAQRMVLLPEVNWSEICRQAITNYIEARAPSAGSSATFQVEKPFEISNLDAAQLEEQKARFVKALGEAWGLGIRMHVLAAPVAGKRRLYYTLKKLSSKAGAKETVEEYVAINEEVKPVHLLIKVIRDPTGFGAGLEGTETYLTQEEFQRYGLNLNEVFATIDRFIKAIDVY
jgi:hypothetical protein